MTIDYDHSQNVHTLKGAKAALSVLFGSSTPGSLLDVGCGTGTWMQAASELGVADVFGIDGISVSEQLLHCSNSAIERHDLSIPFDLRRRFDVVLCLEVAEHLTECSALNLISSIVAHADTILFSAACPGQPGQCHVNCQWPAYWQDIFNRQDFCCDDSARWAIWKNADIEPWYRQNLFWARYDPAGAGHEPRINSVIHPALVEHMCRPLIARHIEGGFQPLSWYLAMPPRAFLAKLARRVRGDRKEGKLPERKLS
jgi:SAM-dependent methyltransferase